VTRARNFNGPQVAVGAAIVLAGAGLAVGALGIPGDAGYGGVGPNFLPWLVAAGLVACGILILREALTGGFRLLEQPDHAGSFWPGAAMVSAGLLANAALITTLGFVVSCALCYTLAVQGLRRAEGQARVSNVRALAIDAGSGIAISAPVYWMFTKFLAINLPGLTSSGWL
jgi:putative tricarboxylic transport membrane protein